MIDQSLCRASCSPSFLHNPPGQALTGTLSALSHVTPLIVSVAGLGEGFIHTHPSSRLAMRVRQLAAQSSRCLGGPYLLPFLSSQMYKEPY